MTHPTMRIEYAEKEMAFQVLARLSILANHGVEFSSTKPTKKIQIELAELRRQRDLAQELALEPGANVPALKAKIADLGVQIDDLQIEHDTAVSADIGGASIDAALQFLHTTPSEGTQDPWSAYWGGVGADAQRTLIRALMPNTQLLLAKDAEAGLRLKADELPSIKKLNEDRGQ
jgi:hypothetical protein